MAKAVLISIRPGWVSRILGGEKTLEVRKSRPKLEAPFKCYIYCAKGRKPWVLDGFPGIRQDGNVVAEFTCDKIDVIRRMGIPENFDYCYLPLNEWGNDDIETEIRAISASCVSKEELNAYGAKAPLLYGWHISALRIYDTPRDLSEFERPYECNECDAKWATECNACHEEGKIKRPPQSWCYVEELERTRWIPCSERLPEDGQDVLCWYQYFRYGNYNRLWQTYGIGFQYNGNWGGEVSTGRDTKVLFWMPLPEPPKEDKNGRT